MNAPLTPEELEFFEKYEAAWRAWLKLINAKDAPSRDRPEFISEMHDVQSRVLR